MRVGAGLSSPGRALLVFSAILAAFLGVTVLGIVYHERDMLRNARREAQQELELLSTLLREPLLENDYASVEAFMTLWGEEQEDVVALRAVAPDGSVLAGYERQEPSDYVVRLEKEVEVDGGQIVTLEAVKDFTPIRRSLYRLGVALIAGAVAMTALLGFAPGTPSRGSPFRPWRRRSQGGRRPRKSSGAPATCSSEGWPSAPRN